MPSAAERTISMQQQIGSPLHAFSETKCSNDFRHPAMRKPDQETFQSIKRNSASVYPYSTLGTRFRR